MNGSWKTTVLGVLTILLAVAGAAKVFLATGALPDVPTFLAAVTAGIGLIKARDNNVTSKEAGAE